MDDIMTDLNDNAVSALDSEATATSISPTKTTAPLKPSEYVHSELITISVGREKKKYHVYKDLLTTKSVWFASRLKEGWKREPNEVNLEHHKPSAFDIVLNWMFGSTIHPKPSSKVGTLIWKLAPAYRLANELLIVALENDIVDMVLASQRTGAEVPGFKTLVKLWDMDLSATHLFRLALRARIKGLMMTAGNMSLESRKGVSEVYARPELLALVFEKVYEYTAVSWRWADEEPKCTYHDHSDGSSCEAEAED